MREWTRFIDWPLHAKMAALLIVASLVPLAIGTLLNVRDARTRLMAQTGALLSARDDQLVSALDNFNQGYQQPAERMARLPNVLEFLRSRASDAKSPNAGALEQILNVLPAGDTSVIGVAIVDRAGVVAMATDRDVVGTDLSSHGYVKAALQGAPVVSNVHVEFGQKRSVPAIAFVAPVLDLRREVIGSAIIWTHATALWRVMKASDGLAGAGSFAVLFDDRGTRIAQSRSRINQLAPEGRSDVNSGALLEDTRAFPEQFARAHSPAPNADPFRSFSPVTQKWSYGVARRLATVPWTVFYMAPEDSLLAHIGAATRQNAVFAGVITLVALLAGALFAAAILRPIHALIRATRSIASGGSSTRVPANRGDELGRLGMDFNRMAERIEGQTAALQAAHDKLESGAEMRTADLAQAQESSRASEHLLERIVESSDDAIMSKTLQGIITSWNPAAERLFGFRADQAIGRSMQMLIPPERSEEEADILRRIALGEAVNHFETTRLTAAGGHVEISTSISPLKDGNGRIIGASINSRDITEQNNARHTLQAQLERLSLLQQITRGIGERQDLPSIFQVVIGTLEDHLAIDFGCICLYSAPDEFVTVRTVGTRSSNTALALGMLEQTRIQVDADGLSACVAGQLVYEADLSVVPFHFPQRLAEAGLRSLVIAPLLVKAQVFGVLVVARRNPNAFSSGDCEFLKQVTEHTALAAQQGELYAALQTAYENLRKTQQAVMEHERLRVLGQLASGIAHDINNAISPISLYTESLLETEPNLSVRARDYLTTIKQAINDVAETVARMKEFYRDREPQILLGPVQLEGVVKQVVALTRARWSNMSLQKGTVIDIATDFAPGLPPVLGIESEIREALTNLVLNAVDAMPQGGTITLRTRRVDAGQEAVCLEVIDTGCGMDDATRRRCLEPFFTTKGERGTGLGLAMVYGAMQRNQARIEVDSAPGEGTTVRLTFCVRAESDKSDSKILAQLRGAPPLHILLVDDDPILLRSMREILTSDGHKIATATGGEAGIEAFRSALSANEPFALVVTDLGMPHVDGRKVASAVKSASPSTPVIMLTGWGQRMVLEGDVPPHVDRVLSKPPKLADLRLTVAELSLPAQAQAQSC